MHLPSCILLLQAAGQTEATLNLFSALPYGALLAQGLQQYQWFPTLLYVAYLLTNTFQMFEKHLHPAMKTKLRLVLNFQDLCCG